MRTLSSTKSLTLEDTCMPEGMSLIKKRKRIGPRTVPLGTSDRWVEGNSFITIVAFCWKENRVASKTVCPWWPKTWLSGIIFHLEQSQGLSQSGEKSHRPGYKRSGFCPLVDNRYQLSLARNNPCLCQLMAGFTKRV